MKRSRVAALDNLFLCLWGREALLYQNSHLNPRGRDVIFLYEKASAPVIGKNPSAVIKYIEMQITGKDDEFQALRKRISEQEKGRKISTEDFSAPQSYYHVALRRSI